MRDQELAALMADYDYRIPLEQLSTKKLMIAYLLPQGLESLLGETTKHSSSYVTALRRQVRSHYGGWGIPEALDQDQDTGRAILWVQLYVDRVPPGPDIPVVAKFAETPDSSNYNYRCEYLFIAGKEPVLEKPRLGTVPQQAAALERTAKADAKAERASRNERSTYKRTRRLSERDAAYREIIERRAAYEAELDGATAPGKAGVTSANPRGPKRAPRKNWY